jgi:hypothetical protein
VLKIVNEIQIPDDDQLYLHRLMGTIDTSLLIAGILLYIPTLGFAFWPILFYLIVKEIFRKTYLVRNEKTREIFKVDRKEYKVYRRRLKLRRKKKENTLRSISELEANEKTKQLEAKADYLSKITKR